MGGWSQKDAVRQSESQPCRDGDVYVLKSRIPASRQGWRARLAYVDHCIQTHDLVRARETLLSMIDAES